MKLYPPVLELVQEAITRINDAFLNELGSDIDAFIRLPELPLIDLAGHEIGSFVWDNEIETWYFRPHPNYGE